MSDPCTRIFLEGGQCIDVVGTMETVWELLLNCHKDGQPACFPRAVHYGALDAEGEAWIKPFSVVGIMSVTQSGA